MKVETCDDHTEQREAVRGVNFTRTTPTPMINPYIGALSDECMQLIGLGDHTNMNQKELA